MIVNWPDLPPFVYYEPLRPRVVLALAVNVENVRLPTPLEMKTARFEEDKPPVRAISTPIPVEPGSLPPFQSIAGSLRAPAESILQLFPTAREEVSIVAGNWLAVLGEIRRDNPHSEHVSMEVGDDWHAYQNFLGAEKALAQAIQHYSPSDAGRGRLGQLNEAIELGNVIIPQLVERRPGSGVAIFALCTVIPFIVVGEKVSYLGSVARLAEN